MKKILCIFNALIISMMFSGCHLNINVNTDEDGFHFSIEEESSSETKSSSSPADESTSESSESVSAQDSTMESQPDEVNGVRLGYYRYDDSDKGEYFAVENITDTAVSGIYIYKTEFGDYGKRDFEWKIESKDPFAASEVFQNQIDNIIYNFKEDRITVDYPDGWWVDRDYIYYCSLNETDKTGHEDVINGTEQSVQPVAADTSYAARTSPFYGIWVGASKDRQDCENIVNELKNKGFEAAVYETTDWENLNSEHWFVVSVGEYPIQDSAETALTSVKAAGYPDAYVKYTGNSKI